ncbi:hypothetical protein [Defluviimonas salinarum]|uniref:Glycosyl transferase family 28 C-terminal domain-containing protein n=1 Tax=Defluviimonas salinarum TaxID=2992147 RepID=A0ABT3J477_9RHOB|nr:hypothetical protein [Defluviimonas salinarum]MCW3782492.1 hypothetical protein [Defluviimonas salinarum]
MIFCDIGSENPDAFEELTVFTSQLEAAGIRAGIGRGAIPASLNRNAQFDCVTRILGKAPEAGDTLVLLRAHEINDRKLTLLRRMDLEAGARAIAVGRFPNLQAVIGIKSKLSYVLGDDPEVVNVPAGIASGAHHMPVFGVKLARAPRQDERPVVLLVAPDLKTDTQRQALLAIGTSPEYRVAVLTDGKTKQEWGKQFGTTIPFYHYGEILPAALAPRVDACMIFSAPSSSYRTQSLVANLAVAGAALIDGSRERGWSKAVDAFLHGPSDLLAAGSYLANSVIRHLALIRREVLASGFTASVDMLKVVPQLRQPELADTSEPRRKRQAETSSPVLFVPTNGVGLGHAQRCSLIATEMDRTKGAPTFAAFPSCMKMLKGYGFEVMPLVSRSPLHAQEHENDLVNYARLKALSAAKRTLVFDGGYVFDSIYRSIVENNLNGVWVRRGMWQAGQDNSIALDREKAFSRVIVPTEAFEELNTSYSSGSHLRPVGPIVQQMNLSAGKRRSLRKRIAAEFGTEYRHLVVTMLGGGVAADRSAQIAAICAMMARRPDTLNLVVVWPTATVEAGAFSWPNTRVVKTHHASALVAAADLYISAVGYNSFHEAMYNRVPTIFMAQMNAFMDDQQSRAMAAVSRGLADIVEPHEMLTLSRKVTEFLDNGRAEEIRANLAAIALPETGNAQAARLIMEMSE